ncbi:MAG: CheR family methyltransferase [Ignavibacteriales bacterium]
MAFTYFFRDVQTLEMIRDYALPDLRTRMYIDIWDAGCAMGHEPYTLAIILKESMGYMQYRNVRIKATDLDESNLFGAIIQAGSYPREQIERIPEDILKKYFTYDKKTDTYTIIDEIKKSVKYMKHNLLSMQPAGNDFSLILCKNVLLHFNEAQRIEVIKMFHNSLVSGGYFATEQTQKMPAECEGFFERVVSNAQLFRKK